MKKKVLHTALWALAGCGILVLLGFVEQDQQQLHCKGMSVEFFPESGEQFIVKEDVSKIMRQLGYALEGDQLCTYDVADIENHLRKNPFVEDVDVYLTIDGYLKMDITRRQPVLRVFNNTRGSFYLDKVGKAMPVSGRYTARVPVASGQIPVTEALLNAPRDSMDQHPHRAGLALADGLYTLAITLHEDPFWQAQISQIYVNENGDIELIPRVGSHRIIIGSTDRLTEKLNKLMILYEEGFSKTGWNEYSVINLKFENQVVCTKK